MHPLREYLAAPAEAPFDGSPIGLVRQRYEAYLKIERELDAKTLLKYAPFARKFLVSQGRERFPFTLRVYPSN